MTAINGLDSTRGGGGGGESLFPEDLCVSYKLKSEPNRENINIDP